MSYSKCPGISKYSCTDYTKDAKNWIYYASSENVTLLPIPSRIAYKIDSLCHTALTTAYPQYLSELLNVYTPARLLRSSSDPNILSVATARTKSYGQRAFAYQRLINWNRVPGSITTMEEKDTFKRHLKQHYFSRVPKISTLSHHHFILLFIISSCVHYCSVLFQCDCLAFWILC